MSLVKFTLTPDLSNSYFSLLILSNFFPTSLSAILLQASLYADFGRLGLSFSRTGNRNFDNIISDLFSRPSKPFAPNVSLCHAVSIFQPRSIKISAAALSTKFSSLYSMLMSQLLYYLNQSSLSSGVVKVYL